MALDAADKPLRGEVRRSPAIGQTVLLGLVCFCVPGMWNSITAMAGGVQDPAVSSAATACLYICFAMSSLVAPVPTNVVGPRVTLFLGSLGYAVYVVALLLFSLGSVPGAVVVLAGAINGVGAGLLWTAQGTLIMSYPTQELTGSYVAVFWVIFNSGAVVGGLVSFALNYHSAASAASPGTFLAFLTIMLIGSVLCWVMRPLNHVARADGSEVRLPPTAVATEISAMARLFADRRMLALLPLFVYSNFFYAYQFTAYNSTLFNARTQGLNNAAYWSAQMIGAVAVGRYLDSVASSPQRRGGRAFTVIAIAILGSWALGVVANHAYGLDGNVKPLDFTHSSWLVAFSLYVYWGFCDAFIQCWVYWFLSQLDTSPDALARFAGFYKGVQSAGGAVGWVLSATLLPSTQVWVNVALILLALPTMSWVIGKIPSDDAYDLHAL
jgi:MFS family permease